MSCQKNKYFIVCILLLSSQFLSSCSFQGFGAEEAELKRPVYHFVKKGESLLGISSKFYSTPDEVLILNGLQTAKSLRVGQKLLVGYRYPDEDENLNPIKKPSKNPSREDNSLVPEFRNASIVDSPIKNGNTSVRSPVDEKSGGGVSVNSVMFSGGRVQWPLDRAARIVSGFGPRWGTFHDGIDLASPQGTPVLAAHKGVVAYAGSDLGGYGNLVVLKGDDGLISVYAHNKRLDVDQGDKISKGQKIAEVGETGKAEGPHLHFEIRSKDKRGRAVAVDPIPLLKPIDERPRFRVNESLSPLLAWLE